MKIALLQYNPEWENKEANKKKILSMIKDIEGVELFIFPEMTLTGFTMKSNEMSETIHSDSYLFFSSIAREKSSNIFAGIVERRNNKNYNTLIHIKPDGKLLKLYRKIHPFSYSSENKHYHAGSKPAITKIRKWNVGLTICYDLRFPELFRKYGKKRTQLIVNIANWPDTRIEHWRSLLKSRAIENQCYIAGVNRVGDDPKLHYTGFSSVFDPMGKEIITFENEEKVIVVDINKNYVKEVRERFPFLDDIKLV
jgi:predicted amidohydrolase